MTWEAIGQGFVIAWGGIGALWGFLRVMNAANRDAKRGGS